MAEYSFQAGYYEWLLMTDKDNKLIAVIGDDAESIFEQPNDTEKLSDFKLIESYSKALVDSLINQAEELLGGSVRKEATDFSKESSNDDIERLKVFLEDKNNVENLINTITDAYCAHYYVGVPLNSQISINKINQGIEDWINSEISYINEHIKTEGKFYPANLTRLYKELEEIENIDKDKLKTFCYAELEASDKGINLDGETFEEIFEFNPDFVHDCYHEYLDNPKKHNKKPKEYATPKRDAVRDSESVGKGAVSRPVNASDAERLREAHTAEILES